MDPKPEPTREELIAELIREHGFDRAAAEAFLDQHNDVVELADGELDITVEEES